MTNQIMKILEKASKARRNLMAGNGRLHQRKKNSLNERKNSPKIMSKKSGELKKTPINTTKNSLNLQEKNSETKEKPKKHIFSLFGIKF